MLTSPEGLETVVNLRAIFTNRCLSCASLALLLYDHTKPQERVCELTYGWKAELSWVTVVFLLNRYLTAVAVVMKVLSFYPALASPEYCKTFFRAQQFWIIVMFTSSYVILARRVQAMHKERKWIRVLVGFAPVSVVAVAIGISLSRWRRGHDEQVVYLPSFKTCFPMPQTTYWISLVCLMMLDVLLFGLTISYMRRTDSEFRRLPLVHVLIRDQTVWFLVMIVTMGVTAVLLGRFRNLSVDPDSAVFVICQVATARLFFNLRSAADTPILGPNGSGLDREISHEMRFAISPESSSNSRAAA